MTDSNPHTADIVEPCPFVWCDGTPLVVGNCLSSKGASTEFVAGCPDCNVFTPQFKTAAEAISAWNTRTPDPEAAAEIKALREALERAKQWFAGYVANGGKGADEELQMLERFNARA